MNIKLTIDKDACTKCGKCVKVCPAHILTHNKVGEPVDIVHLETCIACGHCVAACPENAVVHSQFPIEMVHTIDYEQMPTPEQVMLLCKSRRSNRAFSTKQVPAEKLEMIVEAAHRAPTGSNLQEVHFTLITDPEKLKIIIDFTIGFFEGMLKKLKNPILSPLIKMVEPDAPKYIKNFERMKSDYYNGNDPILRKATGVLLVHSPKSIRFGLVDSNLAYQNASLMAESLGVSQFYLGFVMVALEKDKKGKLAKTLNIDEKIHAGMALAMPQFRFSKYIDRKDVVVTKI